MQVSGPMQPKSQLAISPKVSPKEGQKSGAREGFFRDRALRAAPVFSGANGARSRFRRAGRPGFFVFPRERRKTGAGQEKRPSVGQKRGQVGQKTGPVRAFCGGAAKTPRGKTAAGRAAAFFAGETGGGFGGGRAWGVWVWENG